MNNLGKYIMEQRTTRKLSMRKLASLAQISHTEIHRLEIGKRKNPSPLTLRAIAKALGLTLEELLQAAGYTDRLISPPAAQVRLPGIEELDEKELEEVRDFIDFLRNKKKYQSKT